MRKAKLCLSLITQYSKNIEFYVSTFDKHSVQFFAIFCKKHLNRVQIRPMIIVKYNVSLEKKYTCNKTLDWLDIFCKEKNIMCCTEMDQLIVFRKIFRMLFVLWRQLSLFMQCTLYQPDVRQNQRELFAWL